MATISKLSNPIAPCSSQFNTRSSTSTQLLRNSLIFDVNSKSLFKSGVSSSRLSLQSNRASSFPFLVKCSQSNGNGSAVKRTTLHDLYEKEGQSPWYDNLCRPVTDLLPLIDNGVRGVTSNPAIFQKAISSSDAYNDQFSMLWTAQEYPAQQAQH